VKIWSVWIYKKHWYFHRTHYYVPCTTANPGAAKWLMMVREYHLRIWILSDKLDGPGNNRIMLW
jgi:hypothetical protein